MFGLQVVKGVMGVLLVVTMRKPLGNREGDRTAKLESLSSNLTFASFCNFTVQSTDTLKYTHLRGCTSSVGLIDKDVSG